MAVEQVDGRWTSRLTVEEQERLLQSEFEHLSDEEKEVFQLMMLESEGGNVGDDSLLQALNEIEYEHELVSPEQWLEDDYYFGEIGQGLWSSLKDDFVELFSGDYMEIILTGSIGWGKTEFASAALIRMIYELSCMANPAASYGLQRSAEIVFPCYSKTAELAKEVAFGRVWEHMETIPFFREQLMPKKTTKEIFIKTKNLKILPHASNDTSALGKNVFGGIVDESNFIRMAKPKKGRRREAPQADKLYGKLLTRIKSRFQAYGRVPGMLIAMSSKTSDDAFIERKLIESRANPRVFVRDYAIYDAKKEKYAKSKRFRILVGRGQVRSRILAAKDDITDILEKNDSCREIRVPMDFYPDFDGNLEDSLRDIAGVSTQAISPFIHRTDKLEVSSRIARERYHYAHPFTCVEYDPLDTHNGFDWERLVRPDGQGAFQPRINPEAIRHVHIDPSMLIQGGDSVGLAMGHVAGLANVIRRDKEGNIYSEQAPLLFMDLMLRIVAPANEEASLGDVRRLVYELTAHGFPVRFVSMDRYQSVESLHKLAKRGYRVEVISIDTDPAPYDITKEALYEERLIMYEYAPALEEALKLEWDEKRRKVDHPDGGSKDVMDAVAGVAFTLTKRTPRVPVDFQQGVYHEDPAGGGPRPEDWVVHGPPTVPRPGPETLPVGYKKDVLDEIFDGEDDDYDNFNPIIVG